MAGGVTQLCPPILPGSTPIPLSVETRLAPPSLGVRTFFDLTYWGTCRSGYVREIARAREESERMPDRKRSRSHGGGY
jgi:hypothetical protein